MQSYLVKKALTGTIGGYRAIGALTSIVSPTIGTAETDAGSTSFKRPCNHFLAANNGLTGTNRVQAVLWFNTHIYTFNEANGWTSRYTTTNSINTGGGGSIGHSGLYLVNVSGTPTIIGFFVDGATGAWKMLSTTDSTWKNWTEAATGLSGTVDPHQAFSEIIFNNVYYQINSTHTGYLSYDPSTGTLLTSSDGDISSPDGQDLCVNGNSLYRIAASNTSINGYWLWVLVSGVWTKIVQLPHPGNGSPLNIFGVGNLYLYNRPILFNGGDGYMYAIYTHCSSGTSWGVACAQITPNGLSSTASDVTSAVIPAPFRYAGGRSSSSGYSFYVSCETKTVPGNSTPIAATVVNHIWVNLGYAGSWDYMPWNGPATLLGNGGLAVNSGMDVTFVLPHNKDTGNDRIWYPGDFGVQIVPNGINGSGTNINVDFIADGPLGTEIKSALIYFNVRGEQTVNVAKLISCSKVSGSGATPTLGADGHSIHNVTCDGATVYRVVWDAMNEPSPGPILNNESVEVAPRIF